jgi:DNA topoisomerase-1
MDVVIVESPAKAKTIQKYLGPGHEVLASYGHVRDLPPKDGSVEPDEDFRMHWQVDAKAGKRLTEIANAVKGADRVILATDPDREGEAISWHVLEVLRQKRALKDQAVERVVFNAITRQAVLEAMKRPREVDIALVDAYLARRALDYLVGFTLSPVLWRKLPGARSAGRVQSVALRLVCDREREIETFVSREYWSIVASLATPRGDTFEASLVGADGKRISRLDVGTAEEAAAFRKALDEARFTVASIDSRPGKRHPQPPFTTSTLQQEASRKLGFSASRTMQVAQKLYEGISLGGETVGLITYMRTDGVGMAGEAITAIRNLVRGSHGDRYVPAAPRLYKTKAKNAQEAHEAIRPTDPARTPAEMRRHLHAEEAALYELVWKRAVASQMESAEVERTTADIAAEAGGRKLDLRATGTVLTFDGFLALYQEGRDDEEGDDDSRRLPKMAAGEPLDRRSIAATQHFTEPPPRYTEASLVKRMEELGIGRPSTYAATMSVLRDRGYVVIDKKRLVPEDKGRLVTAFLESFFSRYVEYDFTADLEEQLDRISNNELDWKEVLREFWKAFHAAVEGTKELRVKEVLDALGELLGPHIFPARADGTDPRACPTCGTGQLSLKLGKFGAFVGCSNYPECRYTRPLAAETGNGDGSVPGESGDRELGLDPATGEPVLLREGRFGPYVQLGQGEKPKRSSLPKDWPPASIDLERALALLSLPRLVGAHPESGKPISAGLGRYGPFVEHGGVYANLDSIEEVLTVGLNRAVDALAAKLEKRGGGRGTPAGRPLGEHPELGGPVAVRPGRYGPYVNHGKVNATLPRGADPDKLTLEEAVALLAAKGPAKSAGPKRSAGAAKAGNGKANAAGKKKPTAQKIAAAKKPAGAKPTRRAS